MSGPQDESDEDLIRACVAGDARAVERLVERHRRVVYHAIRGALERAGARDDADLCDEAFVRVFSTLAADGMRVLRSFGGRSRLATFLVVIARRVALKTFSESRPRRSGRLAPVREDGEAEPLDARLGPLERAEREEARELVRRSIDGLSSRDALAIRLFYEHDLGHKEIGRTLGVPVTHVGQILARAREKLRARLDRQGLGQDRTEETAS